MAETKSNQFDANMRIITIQESDIPRNGFKSRMLKFGKKQNNAKNDDSYSQCKKPTYRAMFLNLECWNLAKKNPMRKMMTTGYKLRPTLLVREDKMQDISLPASTWLGWIHQQIEKLMRRWVAGRWLQNRSEHRRIRRIIESRMRYHDLARKRQTHCISDATKRMWMDVSLKFEALCKML